GEDGSNGNVVKPAASGDGGNELGEDALIAGAARIGSADIVGAAEKRDAAKEEHEQHNDDGEGPFGVTLNRLAKGVDAIGDGFHTGHRGAATGEDLQQK